ncbi:MAG TPA: hypothetical protein VNJ01_14520 [Bacteriovoracaceae bacterium]|nr:hypothetical protein [Bacteriovoracaceae bacterium]
MKFYSLIKVLIFVGTSVSTPVFSQSLVEDADLASTSSEAATGETFTETIKIISASKKIFILTNTNDQLGMGDFISLALENNLAARAVVAKSHQGQVGIKILKIYSLAQWSRLRREQAVQIIKGDDSYFGKKVEAEKIDETPVAKIKSEEDLFTSDVVVDDDIGIFDENKNRHIKPDNLVAVSGAYLDASEVASRGGTVRANELGFSWGYQVADNYFLEGVYGRALLDNFPGDNTQTLVNHLTARLKYNIKGPLYTFFMPYIGFRNTTISSPDAGKTNAVNVNLEELEAIEELKKSGPVFGVTILRRLVPGWFVKADLGSDIVNVGFAIEF